MFQLTVILFAGAAALAEPPAPAPPAPAQPAPAQPARAQARPDPWSRPMPGEVITVAEAPGVKVFYFRTPLVRGLAEAFQSGNERVRYTHRAWPFARLETSAAFSIEGTPLPPGNYALIVAPSRGGAPMSIEVRRVAPGEFLVPGVFNLPPGETVARLTGAGTRAASVAPAFRVSAQPRNGGGAVLNFFYGEWQATKELLP